MFHTKAPALTPGADQTFKIISLFSSTNVRSHLLFSHFPTIFENSPAYIFYQSCSYPAPPLSQNKKGCSPYSLHDRSMPLFLYYKEINHPIIFSHWVNQFSPSASTYCFPTQKSSLLFPSDSGSKRV